MSTARISRWTRRFLVVSAGWFVLSQGAILAGLPARVEVVLGLYGFVLTTVFGKAYSLVPSYFDRSLAWPSAPMVQLPLTTGGVAGLALAGARLGPDWVGAAGGVLWAGGVAVFVGTLVVTLRDNLIGGETGTGDHESDRQRLDRLANAAVPLVILYLVAGTVEVVGWTTGIPSPLGGFPARSSHLLAAGVALLLLFAVGYRLLPRFLVVHPSTRVAGVVLVAGAVGPGLLAWGYPAGNVFRAGAVLESAAVIGFAASYSLMYARSERRRVGFYGPLAGVIAGSAGVALGVHFAFAGYDAALIPVHRRLNLFGLLGLSILGAVYQFYPPTVCPWPGGSDRTALASMLLVAGGLAVVAASAFTAPALASVGHGAVLMGATLFTYLLAGAIRSQADRGSR